MFYWEKNPEKNRVHILGFYLYGILEKAKVIYSKKKKKKAWLVVD